MNTNLHELSTLLSSLQIMHILNEDKTKLYFSDPKFSSYLVKHNEILFLKVFQKGATTQTGKTLELCRMMKYRLLKKLHEINKVEAGSVFALEPLPENPQDLKLWQEEKQFKPTTLFEY